ncbi:hypothetical protein L1987_65019 [Smallanthus sonchifolius]|uniref:Uncharacterized protein n=1 Tax=Smallanthus sonchifolius TaxID=185202 RepID=A0ACB9BTA4_9ASTR|nr:hypothetical protein L1987_65019 [Smallanthus sonchifolius]
MIRLFKFFIAVPERLCPYLYPLNITVTVYPAVSLCPLAITEAERGIPDLFQQVLGVFQKDATIFFAG